jgi:phosphoribosylpyrophosphate synthetase
VKNQFTIFSGPANQALAASIARELAVQLGACHRAVVARITAVLPCFGYARADKRHN